MAQTSRKSARREGVCMLCFLHWSLCTFGITCLCAKEYGLASPGRKDSMFMFLESTDEPLPYIGVYDANGGRWVNIQGEKVSKSNLVLIK